MPYPILAERIAQLLGAPAWNVSANWPILEGKLQALAIDTDLACVATLATVRVESPGFKPRYEMYNGDPQEYFKKYDGRFGNVNPGDGYKYRGRGFIELTFFDNYKEAGEAIGVDLVANPELAMIPDTAAALFAWYFKKHHVDVAANAQDWQRVRKLVNGGLNGYADFLMYVHRLLSNAAAEGSTVCQTHF
jgi:predicted chitinase